MTTFALTREMTYRYKGIREYPEGTVVNEASVSAKDTALRELPPLLYQEIQNMLDLGGKCMMVDDHVFFVSRDDFRSTP